MVKVIPQQIHDQQHNNGYVSYFWFHKGIMEMKEAIMGHTFNRPTLFQAKQLTPTGKPRAGFSCAKDALQSFTWPSKDMIPICLDVSLETIWLKEFIDSDY